MRSQSVTDADINLFCLEWNTHLNASTLERQAHREEMELCGIDPHEFRTTLERPQEQGCEFEEIREKTERYTDLKEFIGQEYHSRSQS